jgi:beta-lactamase regulating signal transducer with metallopeptidase domain
MPFLYFPWPLENNIEVKVFPNETPIQVPEINDTAIQITSIDHNYPADGSNETSFSYQQVFTIIYLLGCIVSLLIVMIGFSKIIIHLAQAKIYKKENYKIALINAEIAPMSFGKYIIISKKDYRENRTEIIVHELAHINYKHTIDLLLLEFIKIVHWFNPMVYALIRDLKQIQEYQVDRKVINSSIDSKAYQLLMIKKCVGTERYALANSFNHCQIKNRIVMMNNQNTKKSKSWKVAIFLPAAALMLMAFGSKQIDVPIENSIVEQSTNVQYQNEWKEKEASFNETNATNVEIDDEIIRISILRNALELNGKVISGNEFATSLKSLVNGKTKTLVGYKDIELEVYQASGYDKGLMKIVNNACKDLEIVRYKIIIEAAPGIVPSNINRKIVDIKIDETQLSVNNKSTNLNNLVSDLNALKKGHDGLEIWILIPINSSKELKTKVETILKNEKDRLSIGKIRYVTEDKPGANKSTSSAKTRNTNILSLHIDGENIQLNNKPVLLDNLAAEIKKEYPKINPRLIASLKVLSGTTKMETITTIKQALRDAKISHINYSSDIKG